MLSAKTPGAFQAFVDGASRSSFSRAQQNCVAGAVRRTAHQFDERWICKLQGSHKKKTSIPGSDVDYLVDNEYSTPVTRQMRKDFCWELRSQLLDCCGCQDVMAGVGRRAVKATAVFGNGLALDASVVFSNCTYNGLDEAEPPNPFLGRADLQRTVRALKLLAGARRRDGLCELGHGYHYEALALVAADAADYLDNTGFVTFTRALELLRGDGSDSDYYEEGDGDEWDLQEALRGAMRDELGVVKGSRVPPGRLSAWHNHSANVLHLLEKYTVETEADMRFVFRGGC